MKRCIDAEKLKADIKKLKNRLKSLMSQLYYAANYKEWEAELNGYDKILSLIDSLQQEQPEISLEKITKLSLAKELPEGFDKEWLLFYHTDSEYNSKKFHHLSTIEREHIIAHHFWNKGYNARKEESISVIESPSKTFPRVNEFDCGSSYRH